MKCLGALPSFFLTSIRKDFVRRIMDVYFSKYNCRAPRPFCKISSLSFLPHVLQFHHDWKSIPVDLFFARFAVQYDITSTFDMSHMFDHWQLAKTSLHFYHYCDQLFAHRIHVRQNLLVSLKKITTWNISGWRPPTQRCDFKMSVIRRHLKKGPVCLQETRWTTSMTIGMQQRFNAVRICSSDAIPTINGGSSGGVAVLVPTSLQVVATSIIVPGRALAVQVSSRTAKFWIFSVYLHPASKQKELQDICKWIRDGNIPDAPCVVSGDFNHIDSEHPDDWNSFVSLLGVESTLQGKTTFVGPKGESSIDDVLVPTEYMQNSSLWPKVYLEKTINNQGTLRSVLNFSIVLVLPLLNPLPVMLPFLQMFTSLVKTWWIFDRPPMKLILLLDYYEDYTVVRRFHSGICKSRTGNGIWVNHPLRNLLCTTCGNTFILPSP